MKTRQDFYNALKLEYETRTGKSFEAFDDKEAWVEETWSSDWTAKDVVDYLIENEYA